MIRKIYTDFIKKRIYQKDVDWLFKRGLQYLLIHVSFLMGKPLCGPILGTLVTNYSCNYHCKMCDLPLRDKVFKKRGLKEFSTSQLKQLLKEFAELGTAGIGFTGGEPLLRKDIFELIKYTKDLKMFAHLNTDGFFLNEDAARKLFASGADSINISLDGACPKTHDTIRNHPGAFDRVMKAAECINAIQKKDNASVRLKFVTVINEINIGEIPDIIKLSRDLNADCIEFIPQQNFSVYTNNFPKPDTDFLKKIRLTMDYLLDVKKKGANIENSSRHIKLFESSFKGDKSPLVCYAGYNSYAVDCYGEIYPCVPWINWGKSAGNVNEMTLKEFWYSSKFNRLRKQIDRCKDCFLNCQAELNILFNILR